MGLQMLFPAGSNRLLEVALSQTKLLPPSEAPHDRADATGAPDEFKPFLRIAGIRRHPDAPASHPFESTPKACGRMPRASRRTTRTFGRFIGTYESVTRAFAQTTNAFGQVIGAYESVTRAFARTTRAFGQVIGADESATRPFGRMTRPYGWVTRPNESVARPRASAPRFRPRRGRVIRRCGFGRQRADFIAPAMARSRRSSRRAVARKSANCAK